MSNTEEKPVKLVVFLSDEERTKFKVACAKQKTSMSQQARELIINWVETQDK